MDSSSVYSTASAKEVFTKAVGGTSPSEPNRFSRHKVAVLFLMVSITLAPGNPDGKDKQQRAVTNQAIELNVYRGEALLLTETIAQGTPLSILGSTSGDLVLATHDGETFKLPNSALKDASEENTNEEAQKEKTSGTEKPVTWVINDKEFVNPEVVKEFPKSAMIRHSKGVDFIDKKLLPPLHRNPPQEKETHDGEASKLSVSSQCNGSTTWTKLKYYAIATREPNSQSLSGDWKNEDAIEDIVNFNKELGTKVGYDYRGLTDLVYEVVKSNLNPPKEFSLEDRFQKHEIKAVHDEGNCGVAVVATALEFLLKESGQNVDVTQSGITKAVLNYPDSRGRIGLTYPLAPEILAQRGIPTSSGIQRQSLRLRGLYKYFEYNRDELKAEEIQKRGGIQRKAASEFVKHELLNGRPVLTGVISGHSDKKKGSFGPRFDKHNMPHAVLIVGYDDTLQDPDQIKYRVLNSWGKSWGENGFGWLYPQRIMAMYSLELQ